jgi:hypothetical protein
MDKRQMWAEQGRPAWLKAMVGLARDALGPSVATWATSLDNIFQGFKFFKTSQILLMKKRCRLLFNCHCKTLRQIEMVFM